MRSGKKNISNDHRDVGLLKIIVGRTGIMTSQPSENAHEQAWT
jgi:hypothetical protein